MLSGLLHGHPVGQDYPRKWSRVRVCRGPGEEILLHIESPLPVVQAGLLVLQDCRRPFPPYAQVDSSRAQGQPDMLARLDTRLAMHLGVRGFCSAGNGHMSLATWTYDSPIVPTRAISTSRCICSASVLFEIPFPNKRWAASTAVPGRST